MKIKLVYPPDISPMMSSQQRMVPPLGIASITSFLRQNGVYVNQEDLDIQVHQDKELVNQLASLNCVPEESQESDATNQDLWSSIYDRILKKTNFAGFDLVGFSVVSPFQIAPTLALAKQIREREGARIVLGGTLVRDLDIQLLKQHSYVDYIIRYEGELPMLRLSEALHKDEDALEKVPSISFRHNGVIRQTEWSTLGFSELPTPDFDGLPLQLYIETAREICRRHKLDEVKPARLTIPYQISTGCLYRCNFCGCSGSNLSYKTPEKVVSDMVYLEDKYSCHFMFKDNLINFNYRYLNHLSNLITHECIDALWSDDAVPNVLDQPLLRKMYRAGCRQLIFGLESGSESVLKSMGKGFTLPEAEKIFSESNAEGLMNYVHLMLGFPYETEEDILKTVQFVKRNQDAIDFLEVHPFNLHSGTAVYKRSSEFKIMVRHDRRTNIPFEANSIFQFDEIEGLSWEDRVKKNADFQRQVTELLNRRYVPPEVMLYLYAEFSDKTKIKQYLSQLIQNEA